MYDVLKDLVVPGLAGIGAVVFGLGAVLAALRSNDVAEQSHGLAEQVRGDELKREGDAARGRYRDQLFRTVEPAVTALLDYRAAVLASRGNLSSSEVRNASSNVIARLRLVGVVADEQDRRLVIATLKAMQAAMATNDSAVVRQVLGSLAMLLPDLLSEQRDLDRVVRETNEVVAEAIRDTSPKP
ncbi:hypothetical protein EAH85_12620 [Curtobacterium flaccumfaciens]|nr:hypothetical protein EAH85_12620 [Curtobacterium flaccumfaciens]